jgi:hypothetical protein
VGEVDDVGGDVLGGVILVLIYGWGE